MESTCDCVALLPIALAIGSELRTELLLYWQKKKSLTLLRLDVRGEQQQ
jgi:hypothetical protein